MIRNNLKKSLSILHTDYVDTYYFHSSRYAFQPELLEALSVVQKEGLAKNVGVSVYYPDEAIACLCSIIKTANTIFWILLRHVKHTIIHSKLDCSQT